MYVKNFLLVVLVIISLQLSYCRSAKSTDVDICRMPEERGRCRALIPRWRYDHNSGKCVQFNFGGCGGNPNNFSTERECLAKCKGN